ncbi:MAG: DUF6855 family protein, partial [Chitinophagaceae bacterium]
MPSHRQCVTVSSNSVRILITLKLVLTPKKINLAKEQGTKENPWVLQTPPLSSEFTMYKDIRDGKDILVCTV